MLQKGFLKPKEEPENTRAVKKSRIFFIVGVLVILVALICMMSLQRPDESFSDQFSYMKMSGMAMFAGIVLVFIGLWINFFAQNRKYKEGV